MLKKILFAVIGLLISIGIFAETIVSESTTTSNAVTTVRSPPPTAISPNINTSNSDLCTVGVAGAVQTQILGISMGQTTRDLNCEKLKNAKALYDMGMKVAAVSVMCQDQRVFDAMMHAGTPCPYNGTIGEAAKAGWKTENKQREEVKNEPKTFFSTNIMLGVLALLLLL